MSDADRVADAVLGENGLLVRMAGVERELKGVVTTTEDTNKKISEVAGLVSKREQVLPLAEEVTLNEKVRRHLDDEDRHNERRMDREKLVGRVLNWVGTAAGRGILTVIQTVSLMVIAGWLITHGVALCEPGTATCLFH